MNSWHPQQSILPGFFSLCLASSGVLLVASEATGQILPDATLGAESSLVNAGPVVDLIEGGATRGSALFHSFSDFNVNAGQQVYFANPTGIDNILSRVTGLNHSQIDGVLGVNGSANLFLINPNGIIFGPDATLDVEGAFLASTSDRFQFADGSEFRATNPNAAPLVNVNIPLGIQLGPDAPAALVSEADLAVGSDLTLVASSVTSTGSLAAPDGTVHITSTAGDVEVRELTAQTAELTASENLILEASRLETDGDLTLTASQTVRIHDSADTPVVVAAGGELAIEGGYEIDIFALNHADSGLRSGGDLLLRSSNPIIGDAYYYAYGDVRVENLDGTLGDLISPNDPVIVTGGNIAFNSYQGASLHIFAGGSVTATGNITVDSPDGATGLPATTFNLSDGTPITINGQDNTTLDIRAGIVDFTGLVAQGGTGDFVPDPPNTSPATSADISIGSITLEGEGQVFLTTQFRHNLGLAPGDIMISGLNSNGHAVSAFADNVTLDARGNIDIAGSIISGVGFSDIDELDGGNITLLSEGSINAASSTAFGAIASISQDANGGAVRVEAEGDIAIAGITSEFEDFTNAGETWNGGDINVISSNGAIAINGSLTSGTDRGNAGDIVLNAAGELTTGTITTESRAAGTADGDSGFVVLRSQTANIDVGNILSSSAEGSASFVSILAEGNVTTASINTSSDSFQPGADADGGGIFVTSSQGAITTGSLQTSTVGDDPAVFSGTVSISAQEDIDIDRISTSAVGGESGFVSVTSQQGDIEVGTLFFTDAIVTQSQNGDARNIGLTANQGTVNVLGTIRSGTQAGTQSGNVTITADQAITTRDITTESAAGIGSSSGSITLTSTNGSIDTSLGELTSSTTGGGLFGGGTSENVVLAAAGDITTGNILTESDGGDSGQITLTSSNGGINTSQGVLTSRTSGGGLFGGDSADITLEALNTIQTGNVVTTSQGGSSGDIALTSFAGGINTTQGELTSETTGTSLFGTGVSADVRLQAEANVATGAVTTRSAFGFSGDIVIRSDNGSINTSGDLNSVAAGGDAAGDVTLAAATNVTTRNIFTQAINGNSGDIDVTGGGNINTSQGLLESRTEGGTAGFVQLVSPGEMRVGDVNASTGSPDVAGDITIGDNSTAAVIIENAAIESTSSALGTGGNIVLQGGEVRLANAQVSAIASAGGVAGNVDIVTGDLEVQDSSISVDSPIGVAGNITIDAASVLLDGGQISARTGQSDANAANIFIDLADDSTPNNVLLMQNESRISATATGVNADGGNISIVGDFIFATPPTGPAGSDIEANAGQGNGGVIDIEVTAAVGIVVRPELTPLNDITASSEGGAQGTITLDALATDLDSSLAELAFEFVDASDQALGQCSFDADTQASEIAVAGRGGLPIAPTAILGAVDNEDDWVTLGDVNRAVAAPETVAENRLPGSAIARHPQALCHHAYQASQQS